MTAADFFARWRVRLGYLLAIVVLLLARPTPQSILLGAAFGLFGLAIRAYAAGLSAQAGSPHRVWPLCLYAKSSLFRQQSAHPRRRLRHALLVRPLLLLFVYFVLVYSFVMRREASELRAKHGAAFDAYAASVPLFFPASHSATSAALTDSQLLLVAIQKES